jgi:hypothetical protein
MIGDKTSYLAALDRVNDELPIFHLGQEVDTEYGRGIIISIAMPHNGLYLSPEQANAVVWYSTEGATQGWVNHEFRLTDLTPIEQWTSVREKHTQVTP